MSPQSPIRRQGPRWPGSAASGLRAHPSPAQRRRPALAVHPPSVTVPERAFCLAIFLQGKGRKCVENKCNNTRRLRGLKRRVHINFTWLGVHVSQGRGRGGREPGAVRQGHGAVSVKTSRSKFLLLSGSDSEGLKRQRPEFPSSGVGRGRSRHLCEALCPSQPLCSSVEASWGWAQGWHSLLPHPRPLSPQHPSFQPRARASVLSQGTCSPRLLHREVF